jgi:hypothetical protein
MDSRHGRLSVLMIVLSIPCPLLLADDYAIPADFRIVARFGSAETGWKSWTTTIRPDGTAIQKYDDDSGDKNVHVRKTMSLNRSEFKALHERVKEARFFSIPPEFRDEALHGTTLILHVTSQGQTHEVSVCGPEAFRDDKDVRRFMAVYAEVLRAVPSPNPEQTAKSVMR